MMRNLLCLGLCLAAAACGVDATDDAATAPVAEPIEPTSMGLLVEGAETVDTTEASTEDGTSTAARAASCTATHDGGKWCCMVIFGKLRCWKVEPPDTILAFQP